MLCSRAAWQAKQLRGGVEAAEANHAIAATHHDLHDQAAAAPACGLRPPKANNVVAWGNVQKDGAVVFSAKMLQDSAQTATALKRVRSKEAAAS